MTTTSAAAKRSVRRRAGQSLIDSCIAVGVICLIFLGLFQLSQIFAAKEFLSYAAARGTRARTVGFNQFMVWKTVRIGTIPNAGKLISPEYQPPASDLAISTPTEIWQSWRKALTQTPESAQWEVEESRIPLYLGADWAGQLPPILDYEDWDTVSIPGPVEDSAGMVSMPLSQEYPLRIPMHRAFYADDTMELGSESRIDNHYLLYLTPTEP